MKKLLFYIALLIIGFNQSAKAQTYTQMVEFADKKVQEGDYYYAIIYYKKAMEIDSNSVEINWKMAEAQRHYKNYALAEYYYQKVYNKESAKIYPKSIFWLATMQHYNGKYNESFKSWKLAKKVFKRKRKSYEYKKSLAEFKSTLWAKKAINDTSELIVKPIDKTINSPDTELAPFVHNRELYYTSLKADSVKITEEVIADEYSLQIYHSKIKDSTYSQPKKLKDVYQSGYHSANGCFSPDGKRFYFSRCDADFKCKIFVGKVKNNKITDIDSLGTIINQEGATTTMPNVALIDGKEILFFVSNREKTIGGLDIWWSEIKNGNQYSKPRNLGRKINSMDDDITPFYHPTEKRLYFSSSWHPGFGGHDIFYVDKVDGMISFVKSINVGLPINSSQNDTYYFYDIDADMAYFSSNRIGSNSIKTPTCCNDIFVAYIPKEPKEPEHPFASLYDLNKKLPVTLYFHNDEPNPRTRDTTTNLTYMQSYEDYIALISKYKREYSKGLVGDNAEEAKEDIADFFIEYVEQGVLDLNEFTRLLLIELEKGYEIQVTVKGFASPLAKTDYNVNLTKRRINSLINYLYAYGNGEFKPYLDGNAPNGGTLTFVQIPFGEYTANQLISDNPNDTKHSVYSRKAALERKIEIQSVSLVTKDSIYPEMSFDSEVYDFGKSTHGDVLTHNFNLTNTGKDTLIIDKIETECGCTTAKINNKILLPGESTTITLSIDTGVLKKGITAKKVVIYSNIKEKRKILTLTTEIF